MPSTTPAKPKKFGLLLYPGFEVLDVFGPLEALNVLSRPEFKDYQPGITLSVISTEKDKTPINPAYNNNPEGSLITQQFVPQYTIHDAPEDLDFLLIPGGWSSSEVKDDVIKWVQKTSTQVTYFMTVCTGAQIAARAGVLDGLRATTNKSVFNKIANADYSGKTYWVAHARWVKANDKVWTTAGVSAGTDGFLAWMKEVYGKKITEDVWTWMEYTPDQKESPDAFSTGLVDVPPKVKQDSSGSCSTIPA